MRMTETDLGLSDGRVLHVYDTGAGDTRLTVFWHHGTPNIGAPPLPLFPASAPASHPVGVLRPPRVRRIDVVQGSRCGVGGDVRRPRRRCARHRPLRGGVEDFATALMAVNQADTIASLEVCHDHPSNVVAGNYARNAAPCMNAIDSLG